MCACGIRKTLLVPSFARTFVFPRSKRTTQVSSRRRERRVPLKREKKKQEKVRSENRRCRFGATLSFVSVPRLSAHKGRQAHFTQDHKHGFPENKPKKKNEKKKTVLPRASNTPPSCDKSRLTTATATTRTNARHCHPNQNQTKTKKERSSRRTRKHATRNEVPPRGGLPDEATAHCKPPHNSGPHTQNGSQHPPPRRPHTRCKCDLAHHRHRHMRTRTTREKFPTRQREQRTPSPATSESKKQTSNQQKTKLRTDDQLQCTHKKNATSATRACTEENKRRLHRCKDASRERTNVVALANSVLAGRTWLHAVAAAVAAAGRAVGDFDSSSMVKSINASL